MFSLTILAALAVVFVSLAGVLLTLFVARAFVESRLQYLVSFSAGVFLVTAGALALEVFHVVDSLAYGIGLIVAGYAGAWGMHALLPETHHHHDATCPRRHGGGRKLLVGDGLHNVADGIILVPAFAASPALGIAVTGSIMIHETLQEISKFFVLRSVGYSIKRALFLCVLSSGLIVLGVVLGYTLLQTAALEGVLLAVSSGFLLHVVVHDLMPTRAQHPVLSALLWQVATVAVGVALMVGIHMLIEDVHVHGDGHDHDHDHEDEDGHDHGHNHDDEDEHGHGHDDDHDHHDDHGDAHGDDHSSDAASHDHAEHDEHYYEDGSGHAAEDDNHGHDEHHYEDESGHGHTEADAHHHD